MLSAQHVGFSYGSTPVLRDVSFAVNAGEFVALVGPNGAGKSTLLRLLLGLSRPDRGSVTLLGAVPTQLRDRSRIGWVPQRSGVSVPATVEEVVMAGRLLQGHWWRRPSKADRAAVTEALHEVNLQDLRHRRLQSLSGGQQQRVFIAKALVGTPDLLVLDEPVAGVDVASQRSFRDALVHLVRDHGVAVLLVSHELAAVAADLDRIVVLTRGTVTFDGPPTDLVARGVSLGVHADDLPMWLEGQ